MIRRRRATLACSVLGAAVVALDGTVLTMALPTLQRDLGADFGQVQWTSTGYLVAVASLLVFAGRLGDAYGHRRLFVLGTLGFAATSAAIALAPGIGWVIALRVLQGVAGALLQPATLGMLRAAFPPDRLAMPIALRMSAIGLAAAAGPLVGGALVAAWGWRSVFVLTAVPALAVAVLAAVTPTPRAVAVLAAVTATPRTTEAAAAPDDPPQPRGAASGLPSLDLPGALLLAVTLAGLVHVLVAVPESGLSTTTALALAAAVTAAAVLARHERRAARPLLPPALLRSRPVLAGLATLLASSAALFGALFVATYLLQDVRGLDPLTCGLWVLPLAVLMVLGAPAAAVLQRRFGPRRTTAAGAALLTVGVLLLSRLDETAGAHETGACFALLGAGFGTVMTTATAAVVHRAPVADAGVAGGLQQTAMNVGPALGVAAATLLMTAGAPAGSVPATGTTFLALAAVAALGAAAALGLPGHDAAAKSPERPVPVP
ncbi:MFS transporter [Streptomyces sp. NPDC047981]|uniref:MFS transporter n=1 Tax=Streptomyces sp. NPDC047981 TaxID=3154610 RepID=UPI00341E7660